MGRRQETGKQAKPETGPQRRCLGCSRARPQCELLRVASLSGAAPVVDEPQRAPGRGAYVCYDESCLQRAWQRRAFGRALKLREAPPQHVWDELASCIKANVQRAALDVQR